LLLGKLFYLIFSEDYKEFVMIVLKDDLNLR
jgi:hypothetical protein